MTLPTPARPHASRAHVRALLRAVGRTLAAVLALALGAAAALALTTSAASANPPGPGDPFGSVDSFTASPTGGVTVTGWAADPSALTSNVTVYGLVDGRYTSRVVTSIARPWVSRTHHLGATPGYTMTVPVPATGSHVLCIAVQNIGAGLNTVLKCAVTPLGTTLPYGTQVSPIGALTTTTATASAVRVTGWADDPDYIARRVTVVLYLDGSSAATVVTKASSAAQKAAGAGPFGAFDITVPVSSGTHMACIWLVNVGLGSNTSLGCNAVDTRGPAGTGKVAEPAINRSVVTEAKRHIGQHYVWGATGPKTFDCSGLVMYSYGKAHYATPRVSEAQFAAARLIPASRAVPGDLVFWHDSEGDVYHVGIYLSPGMTVAAIDEQEGVNYQKLWDTSIVSYGSFTHS